MKVLTFFETSVTIFQSVRRKQPRRLGTSTSLDRIACFPTERLLDFFNTVDFPCNYVMQTIFVSQAGKKLMVPHVQQKVHTPQQIIFTVPLR